MAGGGVARGYHAGAILGSAHEQHHHQVWLLWWVCHPYMLNACRTLLQRSTVTVPFSTTPGSAP
jgi:hypothetical protein